MKPVESNYRQRVFEIVRLIPAGKVTTYGSIAYMVPHCTARMVGYALASLRDADGDDIPWQRVINAQGKISPHGYGLGSAMQRQLLEEEGIIFGPDHSIDFNLFGWQGPGDKNE